jgi:hypothetical protein
MLGHFGAKRSAFGEPPPPISHCLADERYVPLIPMFFFQLRVLSVTR